LKPILPRRRTQEEDDLEEMLDKERYLSLGVDVPEHQLLEGRAFSLFKSDYIHYDFHTTFMFWTLMCVCVQKSPGRDGASREVGTRPSVSPTRRALLHHRITQ
jgi:hypothetical protein